MMNEQVKEHPSLKAIEMMTDRSAMDIGYCLNRKSVKRYVSWYVQEARVNAQRSPPVLLLFHREGRTQR